MLSMSGWFKLRKQKPGEGIQGEELIQKGTVVGIQDTKLSERLQLDPDLTLAKAIHCVRKQQPLLRAPLERLFCQRLCAVRVTRRDIILCAARHRHLIMWNKTKLKTMRKISFF